MIVRRTRLAPILVHALAFGTLVACQPAERAETEDSAAEAAAEMGAESESEAGVVQVTARDFAFEAPAEIPSGWTTIRMTNAGQQHHFLVLWRLPEGRTFQEYREQVVTAFDTLMQAYDAQEMTREEMMGALGAALPEWFGAVEAGGGPGLTAPGRTAQTTVQLEPGTYVMECYVRTPDGTYHGMLGMVRPITVIDAMAGASAPEADLDMTLSNYEITTDGAVTPGTHTVRVQVMERPEGLLGHDVHLARLQGDVTVEEVAAWMDWVDAFRDPPPATFLGGAEQVPAGHTSYFTVQLEPGRYAWVSEEYGRRGMVKEFTVE